MKKNIQVELKFLEALHKRRPKDTHILKPYADLLTAAGLIKEGLKIDQKICKLCPKDSNVRYNLACSYALVGDSKKALKALEDAVELGYEDYAWMLRDEDLKPLHKEERFIKLLQRLKQENGSIDS